MADYIKGAKIIAATVAACTATYITAIYFIVDNFMAFLSEVL